MHVLCCQDICAKSQWRISFSKLEETLKKNGTSERLRQAIMEGLNR